MHFTLWSACLWNGRLCGLLCVLFWANFWTKSIAMICFSTNTLQCYALGTIAPSTNAVICNYWRLQRRLTMRAKLCRHLAVIQSLR